MGSFAEIFEVLLGFRTEVLEGTEDILHQIATCYYCYF